MVNQVLREAIIFFVFRACLLLCLAIVVFMTLYLVIRGSHVISFEFLTLSWSHQAIEKGGIFPAIAGSFLLAAGVAIVSIPLGVCAALFLHEYAGDTLLTRITILSVRNLAGVPSIVFGLFGLQMFVIFLSFGTSLVSASLTLSLLTLPWIISTTLEALRAIPKSAREGAYALGATRWRMIRSIVLPNSVAGILTGSLLGISRAIGETAPIIMVGATFYMSYISFSPFEKFMALPYHLYILSTQHASPLARDYALGVALVLVLFVFFLNIGAFILRSRIRAQKEW